MGLLRRQTTIKDRNPRNNVTAGRRPGPHSALSLSRTSRGKVILKPPLPSGAYLHRCQCLTSRTARGAPSLRFAPLAGGSVSFWALAPASEWGGKDRSGSGQGTAPRFRPTFSRRASGRADCDMGGKGGEDGEVASFLRAIPSHHSFAPYLPAISPSHSSHPYSKYS
jgi:hypothetical protein